MGWYRYNFKQDLWRPDKWERERKLGIIRKLKRISQLCGTLGTKLMFNDIDAHEPYNELYELVESLYGDLEMDKLMQDRARRKKYVDDILEKKGLRK